LVWCVCGRPDNERRLIEWLTYHCDRCGEKQNNVQYKMLGLWFAWRDASTSVRQKHIDGTVSQQSWHWARPERHHELVYTAGAEVHR
jgi:hypothetical protein